MTESELAATSTSVDDDELTHWFCACDENRGLCGVDLTDVPIIGDDDPALECVVCADLDWSDCERCGR